MDWTNALQLDILNDGKKPTLVRKSGISYIDITMVGDGVDKTKVAWGVLDEVMLSDHRYLQMEFESRKNQKTRWIYGNTDYSKLGEGFNAIIGLMPNMSVSEGTRAIREVTIVSSPKIKANADGKPPYWWTTEIQEQIMMVKKSRRKFPREENWRKRECVHEEYATRKKRLRQEIKKSKQNKWKELCQKLECDTFGDAYKIVKSQLKADGPGVELQEEKMLEIFEDLFITRESDICGEISPVLVQEFKEEEILQVCAKIKPGKAPGLDGITADLAKVLVK